MWRARQERGALLIELLVGMTMAIVIFGATLGMLAGFFRGGGRTERQAQAQDSARTTLDRLAGQLRNGAGVQGTSNQPVERYGGDDIVFLTPDPSSTLGVGNPQGLMHVRYCLNGASPSNEVIWSQTATYSAGAAAPATAACPGSVGSGSWATKQAVATNVVNQAQTPAKALFIVRTDASGAVSDVGLDAVVDVDPSGGAPASELQTSLTLRNLNHAPTASISCTASGNGHVACDASGSADPDGQVLSYAWRLDGGTVGGQTGYRLDSAGLVAGSTHSFQVTATDPGGATTSSSVQTVIVQ
jgi:Tfp pilus assembly protein PilW